MRKHRFLILWLLLLLSISTHAAGEAYSFPRAGVRVEMRDGWILVTKDMLFEKADDLAGQGIDVKQLRLDMEADGAAFAIFMGDVRVTLSRYESTETAAWQSAEAMTEADQETLFAAYNAAPYQNAAWVQENGPHLTFDWAFQSDGEVKRFSGAALVAEGALYQLTATGPAPVDVLREANERVLSAASFFTATAAEEASGETFSFVPIEDDGVVVPLDLIDFTGVSYEETTSLTVQTLPNAEVVVLTPNDRLRALADEVTGIRTFRVSTRREMVYEYTISVSLPDRTTSQAEIAVSRQLSPELKMDAYKRQARVLDDATYQQLLSGADDLTGTAATVRGTVAQFYEREGFPCALIYSESADGERQTPVFVALVEPFDIEQNGSYVIYADILGETMPFVNDDGIETEAPVLRARFVQP